MPIRLDEPPLTDEQLKAKAEFEARLQGAATHEPAEVLVRFVADHHDQPMPSDRILAQVLTNWAMLAQDVDLAQVVQLLGNADSVVRGVAEQMLRGLGSQGAHKNRVIEALWNYLEESELVDSVDRAFTLIMQLQDDMSLIFDRLVKDRKIRDWQRGSLIVYHLPMRELLERMWPTSPQQPDFISLIIAALKYCQYPGVVDAIADWLHATPAAIRFPAGIQQGMIATLTSYLDDPVFLAESGAWQLRRERNLFLAVDHLGGNDALMALAPGHLGRLLLLYLPDRLEAWWTERDTRRSQTLSLVLETTKDTSPDIRLRAARWLSEHLAEAAQLGENETLKHALQRLQRDENPNVISVAAEALTRMQGLASKDWQTALNNTDESTILSIIEKLAKNDTLSTQRLLVHNWVLWIKAGNLRLVEAASDAMRLQPNAVLPLVEQLTDVIERQTDSGSVPQDGTEVRRRVSRQLVTMSDRRFFPKGEESAFDNVKNEFARQTLLIARSLPDEEDLDIRENIALILGNIGGPQASDVLAKVIADDERKRIRRQDLITKYYLDPSKESSHQANEILREAKDKAMKTLTLLQRMNFGVFAVGLLIIFVGLGAFLFSPQQWQQISGILVSTGGLAGFIYYFIHSPLDRIQNAMAALVQIEAAFISFVWELNLNSTYIQSQYVAEGILTEKEIEATVERIERAMSLTIGMVATHTKEGGQRVMTRITNLAPAAGELGSKIKLHGQQLQGDMSQKTGGEGVIAINHVPVNVKDLKWGEKVIEFKLPEKLDGLPSETGVLWLSLLVDGMETNALPFSVVKKV